ncbi:hypothetical protein SLEP1_g51350 [Rubroshorea leprosula]|uniref:Ammonium transporter AmtB-like domain-containing protein n=1 Tax=Rubroshorea leprosula TaxID=152421 RepID=A0AAV5M2W6_9ROSI|nr:hypothetical protein SLEP1_g51350 [Rubroshorea leprosula]
MAADGHDAGWHAERSRTRDPLRQHGEEEMGREHCFHGPVRLCCTMLGSMGPQSVFWDQDGPNIGKPEGSPTQYFLLEREETDLACIPNADDKYSPGLFYSEGKFHKYLRQVMYQILGAAFITVWNVVATSFICIFINRLVKLRMHGDKLEVGDDAIHGEEAYAPWGDGERMPKPRWL